MLIDLLDHFNIINILRRIMEPSARYSERLDTLLGTINTETWPEIAQTAMDEFRGFSVNVISSLEDEITAINEGDLSIEDVATKVAKIAVAAIAFSFSPLATAIGAASGIVLKTNQFRFGRAKQSTYVS